MKDRSKAFIKGWNDYWDSKPYNPFQFSYSTWNEKDIQIKEYRQGYETAEEGDNAASGRAY